MTTNCDLEEMRHIAQQKFIELVDSGVEWQRRGQYTNDCEPLRGPNFTVTFPSPYIYTENDHYGVALAGKCVWFAFVPRFREVKLNKDGKPNKRDQKAAFDEYEASKAKLEADPVAAAVRSIRKQIEGRETREQLVKTQKAQEDACKTLQEALKDTATTLAPEVQTGNTEPYSKSQDYPLSSVRKFWQIWRGV